MTSIILPRNWEHAFGYDGEARCVAFYWTPAGDEAMYDDGRVAGDGNWRLFVTLRYAYLELDEQYNLGYSEVEAEHWLLFDRKTRIATILPRAEAQAKRREQWPALEVDAQLSAVDWEGIETAIRQATARTAAAMQVIAMYPSTPCDTCFYSIAPGWLQAGDGGFDRCPVCNGWGFLPQLESLAEGA
jgi:hypothetical protein